LPAEAESADAPLTPDHFGFPPQKPTYSPKEFAFYVGVDDETILREITDGHLRALLVRGSYRIPRVELRHYFLRQGARMFLRRN